MRKRVIISTAILVMAIICVIVVLCVVREKSLHNVNRGSLSAITDDGTGEVKVEDLTGTADENHSNEGLSGQSSNDLPVLPQNDLSDSSSEEKKEDTSNETPFIPG